MYTYPTENATEQRVYSGEGLPGERTLLITDRKEQRITHSLYTADGSIRRKTVSVLGEQDRILEEAKYNAGGRVFRRLVHTYGREEQRIATARYGAQDVFVGPVGKSEYVYSDQGQLSRSHDYGSDGLLIQMWEDTDEQGDWTKRTVSRWVEKFGNAYSEPGQAQRIVLSFFIRKRQLPREPLPYTDSFANDERLTQLAHLTHLG